MRIETQAVTDLAGLGAEWRGLEAEMPCLSFFQSWSWAGCLAQERYDRPVLIRAFDGARLVGLALFNRRGGRLSLAESGEPRLDAPFIEHNAPLCIGGAAVMTAMLSAAGKVGRLVLSGVPPAVLAAAPGVAFRCQERLAPFIDLDAVRARGAGHLALLSANTRQQIRRSDRHFAAKGGLRLERAATLDEARATLAEMIDLHGASWRARGRAGAFADGFMRRFHDALLAAAMPRGEVDLLRLRAGETTVGVLYNFRLRGRVSAYQSGFVPGGGSARPGLSSHAAAVAHAVARGDGMYDFLAGADRYKLSLARETAPLFWAELVPTWSWRGMAARLRAHAASLRQSSRGSSASGAGDGPD